MVNRRTFLKRLAATTSLPLLPACVSSTGTACATKVRLACVGLGNQAWSDIQKFAKTGLCEIVAFCDTDLLGSQCLPALKAYSNVPRFTDFRRMLDACASRVDAVAVMTPDHSHFPVLMDAMRRGLAVFSEKPLCHTFREHELLLSAARRAGVVTQMGNQGHSEENLYQFRHYVETGVLDPSKLTHLTAHMTFERRWYKYGGNVSELPTAESLPKGLDWNAWLAGKPIHPYSSRYTQGEWRCWYDFGSGCLGDWGAHTMDTLHRFFDLGLPTEVKIANVRGWNPFVYPLQDTLTFRFAAKDRRPAVDLDWYEGVGNEPKLPEGYEKGWLFSQGYYLKAGKILSFSDGTAWQGSSHGSTLFRCKDKYAPDYPCPEVTREAHYANFLRAVMGLEKANSPFEVAVPLCELFSLGIAAQRLNRGFKFDPVTKRAVADENVQRLLDGPLPRAGWEEFYRI